MKQKITLIALAMFCVVANGWANTEIGLPKGVQDRLVELQKQHGKHLPVLDEQRQTDIARQEGLRLVNSIHSKSLGSKKVAPRRASAITETPKGDLTVYSRSCVAYYATMFGLGNSEISGNVASVVFGEGNKVYFKDLVSQTGLNTWVEGTVQGSTITVKFPQTAGFSSYGDELQVVRLIIDQEAKTYVPSSVQTLTFNYDAKTGKITSTGNLLSGLESVGIVYADDKKWIGYADYNITFDHVADPLVEAPTTLKTDTFALQAADYEGSLVKVGFSGEDVYIQGIDAKIPESWVKGTVQGDKVVFPTGQYLGPDEEAGYHQYLVSATKHVEFNERYQSYSTTYELANTDIEFTYDAVAKTLTNSTTFLLNSGKSAVSYVAAFDKAKIVPFSEVAATPAAPVINTISENGWDYYHKDFGWGYIDFNINSVDVDSNYIMNERLSYAVWVRVNGEETQLTTSALDYVNQKAETMSEFPYGYSDGWDVYCTGANSSFFYHVIGPEAFGIQAIYRGAGQERRSAIAWENVYSIGAEVQPEAAHPAYPEANISATDKTISFGYYKFSGEQIGTVTNFSKPETYDVAVKIDDPAVVGNYIKSIAFPLQELEGVSDIKVFLTSQLRVEGGKNAADILVKSVNPPSDGFIIVELDKPYLIPEGGVYAGYSLTINDVTSEANRFPIAICNTVAPQGGFYLHTSDGFLKWLDVSEGMGGSSLLSVDIVGSSVKGDALTVANTDKKYVKAGETFPLPLTLENQGGNGAQTVTLAYEVAGQSGSQDFNLNLTNVFGASTQVVLNVPAIAEAGKYILKVKATKVNGKDNESLNETVVPIIALNTLPKKRALLEEYTGLWCGYCPRGYVGLEKLAELYPDEYVLVSYHNGDDMEIMSSNSFPSYVAGFPAAWMDRDVEVDAYYGSGSKEFGIADDLAARNKDFGISDLTPVASLSADGTIVNITTNVIFPYDLNDGNYAVEYILTADGLHNDDWAQSNYYADGAMKYPLYMDQFSKGASYVKGLKFNDVAVLTSEILGGSNNAIQTAEADVPVELTYSFKVAHAVNLQGNPVIQDLNNLKVVALLIDKNVGVVVNANKTKVAAASGISQMEQTAATGTAAFDLMGRRVSQPAKGLFLVNGRKVVLK